jgi:hypothetical protein
MRHRTPLLTLALLTALASPALALFEVKSPLKKAYNETFKTVISGTVASFSAENNVVTVNTLTTYKGTAPADSLQIQIHAPEALRAEIKTGQPVLVFQGTLTSAFHIADHWYGGEALKKPGNFRVTSRLGHDRDESFPGTTANLIKAVEELKAGKSTLIDAVPDHLFPKPVKANFTLPKNATAFAALTINDKTTFIIATADGLKALAQANDKLDDQTQALGLPTLKPTTLTAATIDKKPALILDRQVLVFDGKTFTLSSRLYAPEGKILALAADNLTDDAKPSLAYLTDKSLVRTALANALQPADPNKNSPPPPTPDDDKRLTGSKLTDFHRPHEKGFTTASLASVDLNADKRPDLVLLTPEGTLTLLNRGFNTFLVDKNIAAPLLDPANTKTPSLPLLASTPNTLYTLHPDGALHTYTFPNK